MSNYIKIEKEGYTIYIGKNEQGNDEICRRCHPDSIWFHLKDESSPHIILEIKETQNIKNIKNTQTILKEYKPIISDLMYKYKKDIPNKSRIIYTILKNVELVKNKIGSVVSSNVRIL